MTHPAPEQDSRRAELKRRLSRELERLQSALKARDDSVIRNVQSALTWLRDEFNRTLAPNRLSPRHAPESKNDTDCEATTEPSATGNPDDAPTQVGLLVPAERRNERTPPPDRAIESRLQGGPTGSSFLEPTAYTDETLRETPDTISKSSDSVATDNHILDFWGVMQARLESHLSRGSP